MQPILAIVEGKSEVISVTGNFGLQSNQDNNKSVNDKVNLELAKNIKTSRSCQNTTESSVKATDGSGLYSHHDNETK